MSPKIQTLYRLIAEAAEAGDYRLVDSIAVYIATLTRRYALANKD